METDLWRLLRVLLRKRTQPTRGAIDQPENLWAVAGLRFFRETKLQETQGAAVQVQWKVFQGRPKRSWTVMGWSPVYMAADVCFDSK
jgi:hypothetical protein